MTPARGAGDGGRDLRWWTLAVYLAALVVLVANHPGQVFFDTKLGVDIDPAGFLARLWHLWNPLEWLGAMQDQYIGYAFPMAPFYLAGHLLGMPVWLTERLWLALLIATGFSGLAVLARELRIGSQRSAVAAGLAFALWPTFTIVIGSTSAGLLPGLLAPWAVLPLAAAARGGSLPLAAARSGAAVLCMGGVNATSTLEALILPAMFIVTQVRGRRLAVLAACWSGAVALATSWWAVPLLLQARYSFDFLPYVEQSATTTATMSAAAFLRGAGDWTAYLNLGQPWLPAGWVMVDYPVAILAGAVAAATGLLGIARRDMPAGGWLRLSLGVAALVALAGYPGPLGGPFHEPLGRLLDGTLAPLRSVYKVEPAAAAVLALGIAHALTLGSWHAAIVADRERRLLARLLLAPVIALVLAGLAWPYLSGQVLNAGSFGQVPGYWYRAAAFLRAHSPRAPALVVPAEAHGTYLWGEPVDDPLEPLASSPWAAAGLVPLGGAGSQLLLGSLDAALSSGEQVPGLAAALDRAGISYVVVRNDLNPASVGYTPPQPVHATLASSGFRRVAAFGPPVTGRQTDPGAPSVAAALPSYPAVEVFEADSRIGRPPPSAAVALPVSGTVLVNGGPDALLQLAGQRVLTSAPAVIAGDMLVTRPAEWVVTDGLRRADHAFGVVNSPASFTYTATGTNPPDDPLGGAGRPPRQLLPVPGAGHQTVAVLAGAASVTASSSGSWLAETPQIDPVNAFDGNPATVWAEASPVTAVGQWIQITFGHPVDLPAAIRVRLLDDGPQRAVPGKLVARTRAGAVTSTVRRTGAAQWLRVPPGPTRTLRITIAGVTGGVPGGPGAGFADIDIPGVTVTRYLEPAQSRAGQSAGLVAFSFHRQVPSPASLANVAAYPPLARTFVTSRAESFGLTALAIAVPGRALDAVLAGLTPVRRHTLQVTASSTWGSLPGLAPANLLRADRPGPWIAGGANPVIRLSWRGKRTISRLVVQPLPGFASAPASIKITSPQGVRYADVGLDGLTELVPPLTTSQMAISFPVVRSATTTQPVTGQPVELPVGLSRLSVPALAGLRPATLAPGAAFSLPCGSGPRVTIDGRTLPTRVWGQVGDLTGFLPVHVGLCSPRSWVTLGTRRHWLVTARPGAFSITDLSLASPGATGPGLAGPGQQRAVRMLAWQPEHRQVRVGPGPESYLEVHQNANAGWAATLGGRTLTPVRLDGWQQGFVVPAGTGGVVTLTFTPVKFYHFWIILSALGVLLLLAAAGSRRLGGLRGQRMPALPSQDPGPAARALASSAASPWPGIAALAALAALLAIAGGPAVLVVPALVAVAQVFPGWHGALAFAAMLGAGILTAFAAHPAVPGTGAFGAPAQACALVALGAALTPVLSWRRGDPGGPGRAGGRSPRARFAAVDELTCYYDRRAEPANVHLEVRVPGKLDLALVRAAVRAVLDGEPELAVRRAPAGRWRRAYYWEPAAPAGAELVGVASWADEADLARQRASFLSRAPSLDVAPPVRFLLAPGPGGDRLIVNAHHARFDGLSCLRLLRAVAGEYAALSCVPGEAEREGEHGPAPAPLAAVRLAGSVATECAAGATGSAAGPLAVRGRPHMAARIAGQPDGQPRGSRAGYGVCLLTWEGLPLATQRLRSADASVNDLLITALMIAIGGWNESHGGRPGQIRITMPVGERAQAGSAGSWGNLSRLTTVQARVPAGAGVDAGELLAIVAGQTGHAKRRPGPQVDPVLAALVAAPVPVVVKGLLLRTALRLAGHALCDTSLVSNLGAAEPVRFGAVTAEEAWFSTSAHMPRGLSLGAVTIGTRLRLSFRYRRALFSDSAAAAFAVRYREVLDGFAGREAAS